MQSTELRNQIIHVDPCGSPVEEVSMIKLISPTLQHDTLVLAVMHVEY